MQISYKSWQAFRDEAVPQRSTNTKSWNQSMIQFFSYHGIEQARFFSYHALLQKDGVASLARQGRHVSLGLAWTC